MVTAAVVVGMRSMARSLARLARLALRAALLKSNFEEIARVRVTVASAPLTVRLVARCAGHLSRQIARSTHSAHEKSVMKVVANVPNHTASLTLIWDGAARLTWALHGANSPGNILTHTSRAVVNSSRNMLPSAASGNGHPGCHGRANLSSILTRSSRGDQR